MHTENICKHFLTALFFFSSSDPDEDKNRDIRNRQSGRSEFKDDEETVTTKSVQIVQATETTATRKKGGTPSKTIDLGAAAHYTGDKFATNTNATKVIKLKNFFM